MVFHMARLDRAAWRRFAVVPQGQPMARKFEIQRTEPKKFNAARG
jgi:hypothetical protein